MTTSFCYENIQENGKLVVLYTGFPSSKIFEAFYKFSEDVKINYYLGCHVNKMTKIDQL